MRGVSSDMVKRQARVWARLEARSRNLVPSFLIITECIQRNHKYSLLLGLKMRENGCKNRNGILPSFRIQAPFPIKHWKWAAIEIQTGPVPLISQGLSVCSSPLRPKLRGQKKFMEFAYEDETPRKPLGLWNWCKFKGHVIDVLGFPGSPLGCVNF